MDMLYYIYIGSNRVTIDHLSKITGGMFMAVSSCNKAAKVIDGIRERYNTSILYEESTLKRTARTSLSCTSASPVSTSSSSPKDCRRNTASSICRQVSTTPFPHGQRREPPANGKIPPVAQGAQTAGIQPVTP